MSDPSIAH